MVKRIFFIALISMPFAVCGMSKPETKKLATDEELRAACGNLRTQDAHHNLVITDFPAFKLFRYIAGTIEYKTTVYQEKELDSLDDQTKTDLKTRNYVCTEKFSMARIENSNRYQQLAAFIVGTKDPAVMRWLECEQLKAFARCVSKKS